MKLNERNSTDPHFFNFSRRTANMYAVFTITKKKSIFSFSWISLTRENSNYYFTSYFESNTQEISIYITSFILSKSNLQTTKTWPLFRFLTESKKLDHLSCCTANMDGVFTITKKKIVFFHFHGFHQPGKIIYYYYTSYFESSTQEISIYIT